MPSNLSLRNRSYPAQRQIDRNGHNANNPKHLRIILAQIPENNRKDNAPEIPTRARTPAHDAVGVGMHMRHETEDCAVARFEEQGHPGDEPEHRAVGLWIGGADGDEESSGDDGEDVDEVFLAPDARALVDGVGEETPCGAGDNIEEAEHCGPAAGAGLTQLREVLNVVCAKDGVDGKLGAEGAEVGAAGDEGLEGENDAHGFFKGRLDDDFAAGRVEHLLLADLGFVVVG